MRPILRLQILMRIPIRIEYNHSIGALQIQTQTAGPRRQQKDEVLAVLRVELPEELAAIFRFRRSVQSEVAEPAPAQVVLHYRH